MPEVRVLRPAIHIPDKSRVTKRSGEKVYTLRKQIEMYGTEGPVDILHPHPGRVFIVADGTINEIKALTELLMYCTLEDLQIFLNEESTNG